MLLSVLATLPLLASAHSWAQPRDSPVHALFKRQANATADWKSNPDGKSTTAAQT